MLLHEIKPNIKYSMLLSHNKKNIAGFRNRSSTCNLQELNVLYPNIVSIIEKAIRFLIFIVMTNSSYNEVIHHSLQWYWIIVKFYIYSCAIYDIGIRLRFGF